MTNPADADHEEQHRLTAVQGLAALSLDALSSVLRYRLEQLALHDAVAVPAAAVPAAVDPPAGDTAVTTPPPG